MFSRALQITVAAAVGVLLGTVPASAAIVERVGDEVRLVAAPGEMNLATPRVVAGDILIDEMNVPLTAGSGCALVPAERPLPSQVLCSGAGVTRLTFDLGDGSDRFHGGDIGSLQFRLLTGEGDDLVDGGTTGPDAIDGGPGADDLNGGWGVDNVIGGAGNDNLSDYDTSPDVVEGGEGDDNLVGGTGDDNFSGGAGDDDLLGNDGDDQLDGGGGDDRVDGGRGDDALKSGAGEDDVDGGRGNDRIESADRVSEHTLTCGQGEDQLIADNRDPINVDCEGFDGGTIAAAGATVDLAIGCPGACVTGKVLLKAGGTPLGEGKVGGRARASRLNRGGVRVTLTGKGRKLLQRRGRLTVAASVTARDSSGKSHRSTGRYVLRRR